MLFQILKDLKRSLPLRHLVCDLSRKISTAKRAASKPRGSARLGARQGANRRERSLRPRPNGPQNGRDSLGPRRSVRNLLTVQNPLSGRFFFKERVYRAPIEGGAPSVATARLWRATSRKHRVPMGVSESKSAWTRHCATSRTGMICARDHVPKQRHHFSATFARRARGIAKAPISEPAPPRPIGGFF